MKAQASQLPSDLPKRYSSIKERFGFRGDSTARVLDSKPGADTDSKTKTSISYSRKSRLCGLTANNPSSVKSRSSMSKLPLRNGFCKPRKVGERTPAATPPETMEANMSEEDEPITNAFMFDAATKASKSVDSVAATNGHNSDGSSADSIPRTSSVGSKSSSVSKSVKVSRIHSQRLPHIRHATRKLSLGDADELRRFQDRFQKKDGSPLPSRSRTGRRGSCPTILRNSSFRTDGKFTTTIQLCCL